MNSQQTLKTVVEASKGIPEFAAELPNFLDEFYAHPALSMIEDAPLILGASIEKGNVIDAYAAATAEALSRRFHLPVPSWVYGSDRICRKPFFTMHSPAGRAFVLAYTPSAFKARQLFVGSEPLSRV